MIQCVRGFPVQPRLLRICDQESIADEPAHDAPDEAIEQTLEALYVGRTDAMEPQSVLLQRIDG